MPESMTWKTARQHARSFAVNVIDAGREWTVTDMGAPRGWEIVDDPAPFDDAPTVKSLAGWLRQNTRRERVKPRLIRQTIYARPRP